MPGGAPAEIAPTGGQACQQKPRKRSLKRTHFPYIAGLSVLGTPSLRRDREKMSECIEIRPSPAPAPPDATAAFGAAATPFP